MSATAPLIVGAEKLVPDHRKGAPVWSGARSLTPTAIRYQSAPVPARSEKLAIAVVLESSAPAMITLPENRWAGVSANWSGLAVPSLPAAMTITTPEFTARCIAPSKADPGGDPPSERLITLAP